MQPDSQTVLQQEPQSTIMQPAHVRQPTTPAPAQRINFPFSSNFFRDRTSKYLFHSFLNSSLMFAFLT